MKEKIKEIINHPAYNDDLKATEIIVLWNEMIVAKLKEIRLTSSMETFNTVSNLFIKL